ncbi:MAG: hypothetical protein H6679_01005 [Epsilonproteobacteria bacterium]|nr:hypothetical protein [Campylobacterota bacterium]
MNQHIRKKINKLLLLVCLIPAFVSSMHNGSRYFFFLERPEDYTERRSHLAPSIFFINASTGFKRGGGTIGIPELWGRYDLNEVIASLQAVDPTANPFACSITSETFKDKCMRFKVESRVRGWGMQLSYEQKLPWVPIYVGAWLPIMHLSVNSRYFFLRQESASFFADSNKPLRVQHQEDLVVDELRRATHQLLGFEGNEWIRTGFGDLDLHVRGRYFGDHEFLMKSINLNFQTGVVVPTGVRSDTAVPISMPFMHDGHAGVYIDLAGEFELKQDWKFGLMGSLLSLFEKEHCKRIPVDCEPAPFSALVGRVSVTPGMSYKFATYFTLENMTDGLHFHARYTYLRHERDRWHDLRGDHNPQSYLQKGTELVRAKEALSKWSTHYMTFQVSYDTKLGGKKYVGKPLLFLSYDVPINGSGVMKTHQINAGVQMHF